ncbi:MAG TPA: AAA family ATPase [Steroidobacteraceae bacterium]|nr:AAA family ATPase [Steroidobacteraceae bacterium]
MSLVEKALRKLQVGAPRGPAPTPAPGLGRRLAATVINPSVLRSAGFLPPAHEERQLAQQYRRIKRPLIAKAFGRGVPQAPNGRLILVTSAMAGEGKTFTSLNLALSLAREKDVHVLLVDADVAKPNISRSLGVAEAPGLLDALRDAGKDVEGLIRPTDVSNLFVLPTGTASKEATELLASQRMGQVAAALLKRDPQRIVLFDSPPLLQTTESHALTQIAGQIVVIVRAESTPQPVLFDALKLIEGHPAVSLVLNQSTESATSAYYYHGYGDDRAD